jgi:hypothetical protein
MFKRFEEEFPSDYFGGQSGLQYQLGDSSPVPQQLSDNRTEHGAIKKDQLTQKDASNEFFLMKLIQKLIS